MRLGTTRTDVGLGRLKRIQGLVPDNSTIEQIVEWARGFRAGTFTTEDVQNAFAAMRVGAELAPPVRKRILEAQQELDAIRFGMCESGQRAEIERVFREIEQLIAISTHR